MKKLLMVLMVLSILLLPAMGMAEEKPVTLTGVSSDMARAVRENPVSLPAYIGTQVDFWGEIIVRFLKTAKPMVVFMDTARPGLEITVYEQPKFAVTCGKVYLIEDGDIEIQPFFYAVEWRDFPLLSDLSGIFKKFRPQVVYVDKRFWFGLSYELMEE